MEPFINEIEINRYRTHALMVFISKIILWVFALVSLFSFSSCNKYELDSWPVSYPLEVEHQVNLFMDYAPPGLKARPLTIQLSNGLKKNGKKVSGLCSYKKNTIYLDTTSTMWHNARTRLVMHELGHYVLKRQHLKDTMTLFDTWNGFPVSFMKLGSEKPSDWNLRREDLLEYYMEELFNPSIPSVSTGG